MTTLTGFKTHNNYENYEQTKSGNTQNRPIVQC